MGLFSKLSFKTRRRQVKIECDRTGVESDEGSASVIPSSSLSSSSPIDSSPRGSLHKLKLLRSSDVTIQHLSALIADLEYCLDSKRTKTPKSLKLLFTLSERVESNNRVMMVQGAQERLIPVLLRFLNFCPPKSSEQYLALLILNNISIPAENKRVSCLSLFYGCNHIFQMSKPLFVSINHVRQSHWIVVLYKFYLDSCARIHRAI